MTSQDPSRLRFPQLMRQVVRRLAAPFRSRGMDERGSVLAAGVVILGIFAVMFTAGVRHEGSAQELDILTAHRREALDVSRGGMDALLKKFYDNPGIDGPVASGDYPAELDVDNNGNTVVLTSKATVAGVSETVTVELRREEQNAFENFLGGITIAAKKDITGTVALLSHIEEPVYYGDRNQLKWLNWLSYDLRKTTQQIDIPTPDDVEQATNAQLAALSSAKKVSSLGDNVTISQNTWYKVGSNGKGEYKPKKLTVNANTWLVIEGSLIIETPFLGTRELNLNGNIIVKGGHVKFGNFNLLSLGAMYFRGNGMIICIPDNRDNGIEFGQIGAEFLALSAITSGRVQLRSFGAATGSFLCYGDSVTVESGFFGIDLSTCCLVSNTDVHLDSGGFVSVLRKGAKQQWSNQPILKGLGTGEGYNIVNWREGNG